MSDVQRIWMDWCTKDPSPLRLGIAATTYNWDSGYGFLIWLVNNHELDKSTSVTLLIMAEANDYAGNRNREDVDANLGSVFLPGFDLISSIMTQWNKGNFREQRFSIGAQHDYLENHFVKWIREAETEGMPWTFPADIFELRRDLPVLSERMLDSNDRDALDRCPR